MMTTTSNFSGLDPEARSSSRILRPPGGGSSFSFGMTDQEALPARRYKMASNIFGIPDHDPIPMPRTQETGAPVSTACSQFEDSVAQRMCPEEECGESADYKGEAEAPEIMDSEKEASQAAGEPAQPTPPAPTRRNPPGGKSSLILG